MPPRQGEAVPVGGAVGPGSPRGGVRDDSAFFVFMRACAGGAIPALRSVAPWVPDRRDAASGMTVLFSCLRGLCGGGTFLALRMVGRGSRIGAGRGGVRDDFY